MPPKKRDKELEAQKLPRMDQIQADHELFLQAFEMAMEHNLRFLQGATFKRYRARRFFEDISGSIGRSDLEMMLNERTNTNLPISTDEKSNIDALVYLFHLYISAKNEKIQATPIFLYRNLSYMKQRMSRSHKSRRGFRIDTILQRLIEKNSLNQNPGIRGFMTLTFLGFYDKKIEASQDPVKVETLLLKICHKKRKDVSSPIMQVSVGISDVPINPSENQPPPKAPTISIPNESFSFNNGHVAKTYMLLLRVYCMSNSSCLITSCDLDSEPAQKKRKSSPGNMKNGEEVKLYGSELIVYDKHNRCLLTDGDYELGLQEVLTNVRSSPKKHSSWETLSDIKESGPFEVFSRGPTLKFRLSWTMEASNGLVDRPTLIHPLPNGDNKENRPGNIDLDRCSNNLNNNNASPPNSSPLTPSKMSGTLEKIDTSSVTQQIVYQFLYNNNSRQQTEACEDLHCPWCSLDCGRLYSLLKHLKLCHSRFTFTYVPISQGARIDVAINECYDGSYAGSPHELISQPSGIAFSRTGPTRRTSVTNILVCRPKRTKPSLSEFLELDENEFESQRPYITGHNRLYHHTVTCLPIYPKEMDADSEGENDPRWLQTKTMMMIDDFTDVNEGEKELMKMWNLHVMKYGYVGDCQIPIACQMFLETKGKELLMKNLYRNFVLHMSSLFDFGLISPVVLFQTIQKLQEIMKEGGEDSDVRKVLQKSHEAQVERWLTTGVHDELNKATTTTAKTNFNNEISNHNARRKTTLGPLNSPPSQSIKSILNNASKHATMIGQASNKSITNMNGKTTNSFASINKTNGSITSNNITKAQEINGSNVTCKSEINTIISSDLPPRRKSTNSTGQSIDNPLPIRRKSMASENTSNEYHRRKLILDSIPSGGNVNPKTSQNNDSY